MYINTTIYGGKNTFTGYNRRDLDVDDHVDISFKNNCTLLAATYSISNPQKK
jgi:hypothetical protein